MDVNHILYIMIKHNHYYCLVVKMITILISRFDHFDCDWINCLFFV